MSEPSYRASGANSGVGGSASDPDAIGPDGRVRLRRYLPHERMHWFSAGCPDCGQVAPIGVKPAIEIMGGGEATVGQLERRLRCGRCGERRVGITIASDPRPAEIIARDRPPPESRADPRRRD
jgi:hypothetical protein